MLGCKIVALIWLPFLEISPFFPSGMRGGRREASGKWAGFGDEIQIAAKTHRLEPNDTLTSFGEAAMVENPTREKGKKKTEALASVLFLGS